MLNSRAAGPILLGATLLEVLAMAHHPSVQTPDIALAVQQILLMGNLSGWVHAAALTAMFCIAYGLLEFTLRRGPLRPWMRAGSIAYGTGVLVMTGAALVSGFILPGLVASTPHVSALDLAINAQLLMLCRVLLLTCADVATVAISVGILCWSIDLLRERGVLRVIGMLGLVSAIVPAAALLTGVLQLNVRGMSEVVWLQGLWSSAVAIVLIRSIDLQPSVGRLA